MTNRSAGAGRPKRIQRQRTKGWRMPEGAVYVGRPTKWGNPFKVSAHTTRGWALAAFVEFINEDEKGWALSEAAKAELRGKDLACFCRPGDSCHADVLLELANAE